MVPPKEERRGLTSSFDKITTEERCHNGSCPSGRRIYEGQIKMVQNPPTNHFYMTLRIVRRTGSQTGLGVSPRGCPLWTPGWDPGGLPVGPN